MRNLLCLLPLLVLAAATPAAADCYADLTAVIVKHVRAGPFRVETTVNFDSGPRTTSVEVVVPDRFSFHGIAFFGPGGGLALDGPIIIGRQGWVKQAAGWVRLPAEVKPGERNALYTDLAERHDTAEGRACRGRVERDGAAFDAYTFTSTHWIGGWRAVWETVLYVDPETGLPVLEEVTAGIADLPDQPRQHATLTYSYDPSIRIEPPL